MLSYKPILVYTGYRSHVKPTGYQLFLCGPPAKDPKCQATIDPFPPWRIGNPSKKLHHEDRQSGQAQIVAGQIQRRCEVCHVGSAPCMRDDYGGYTVPGVSHVHLQDVPVQSQKQWSVFDPIKIKSRGTSSNIECNWEGMLECVYRSLHKIRRLA